MNKKELETLHQFYTNKFSYYSLLNSKEKRRFILRTIYIRKRNNLNIRSKIENENNEVELLICAAFAQITFGYDEYEIEKFNKIIIHPKTFYSRYVNQQVKGLTVGSGYIHYSWEDFINGYKVEEDKVNLGLHELAHALYVDRFHNSDSYEWKLWKMKALTTMQDIQTGAPSIFRAYGNTNVDEFWAVAVEVFFEDPIMFKEHHTSLYKATAYILKQDMATRKIAKHAI